MKLESVLNVLRGLAPENLAEPWDNVGLILGDPRWPVRKAMLCIDLTEQVLREAATAGASLVVAYHPPIFSPLKSLTSLDPKQAIILAAANRKIALYSPHTALDAAPGGVNDWLCDGLGDGTRQPIQPTGGGQANQYKLVTFVPHDQADALRTALAAAGAGVIGDYTLCSFSLSGEGTFLGGTSTKPAVGRRWRLERVAELRIEMVCPKARLAQIIAALRQAHPYEEPAFDLYPLVEPPSDPAVGPGRVVTLDKPVSPATLIDRVKRRLGVKWLGIAVPDGLKKVQRLGVCVGAGGSLLKDAGRIDAFVTGEMRHHDVLAAQTAGTMVLLAGHTQTERPYLKAYRKRILTSGVAGVRDVQWLVSKADRAPLVWR